jgi:predicted dehydrogenase
MPKDKVRVAIVGLGFGAEFIPIYQRHPNAELVAICQRTPKKLDAIGEAFGIGARYTDFNDLLKDPNVDAVHINSPIPDHGWQSIAALKAGKHVACTVPMATSIEECKEIVQLVRKTGLKYMMAETVVYAREYLYMRELRDKGTLGKIQFIQASHQQDMDGWPNYWPGLPPMWYATHCVGPVCGLANAAAEYVSCFGSGTIRKELANCYGSPFAVETAHIKFQGNDLSARIIRSLFDTARQYRESIDVYGDKVSVEWPLVEHEPLILHTAKRPEPKIPKPVKAPDYAKLSEGDPRLHDEGRLRPRQEDAPQLYPGCRSWRIAPAPRARVRQLPGRGPRSLPERPAKRELDMRRPLCASERPQRRERSSSCPASPSAKHTRLHLQKSPANLQNPPTQCQQKLKVLHPTPAGSSGPGSWPSSPPASASPSAAAFSITGARNSDSPPLNSERLGAQDSPASALGSSAAASSSIRSATANSWWWPCSVTFCRRSSRSARRLQPTPTTCCFGACSSFPLRTGRSRPWPNPLVATLFPNNRTHYLNILHASWPAGMVIGSVLGWILDDQMQLNWKIQLALYLIPTALYAIMFFGQHFPKSEAAAKGASIGQMFRDVGILGAAVACFLLAKFFADIFKNSGNGDLIGYAIGGALLAGRRVHYAVSHSAQSSYSCFWLRMRLSAQSNWVLTAGSRISRATSSLHRRASTSSSGRP